MSTSTIISWGLTICLVGAAIYVYKPDLFSGLTSQAQETKAAVTQTVQRPTAKKAKPKKSAAARVVEGEKGDSANESTGSKKRKVVSAPVSQMVTANTVDGKQKQLPRDNDGGLSDEDFAKQLAQTQTGTELQVLSKQQQQPSKKERRTSKLAAASSPDPSGVSTEASSTTGRDADDDLTPAESPQAQPQDVSMSRAGDVSDMLEAPGAKPTTLRLTDVSNEVKPKKPANKAFEQVLSKKKRYEQQRKQEQKAAREESDRIHEAKKQEQLRRARIAAGTSNQTKANNFAKTANAWQSGSPSAVKTAPATEAAPLLDTFDPASNALSETHGAVHTEVSGLNSAKDLKTKAGENAAAAVTASANREGLPATTRKEYADEISEEDQMKILEEQHQENAWESVTTKKSKRKGKVDADSSSGRSSPVRPAPAAVRPNINGVKTNGTSQKPETANRFNTIQDTATNGLQDAEWEA